MERKSIPTEHERTDQKPRVAIAHEHFPQHGGGEHVAEELARTFDAPIYTGFANDNVPADDVTVHDLFGRSFIRNILTGGEKWNILFRDLYYMTHWDHVSELHDYDVIVQSGNNPGWYVPREEQTIIKYVHTPPRNPYDRHSEFADSLSHTLYAHIVRTLYGQTTAYPDIYVANSELVARRCEQYFGIDREEVEVVYPPVDVDSYGQNHCGPVEGVDAEEYYFTFSRLFPGKNIDVIVQAFNRLGEDHHLVVGGDGPERERLEEMAGDNVTFLGYVSEEDKRTLCATAEAGIFAAQNEDFGIVPVEFFASGTPVIGVEDGYTKYQVADGKNGYTFEWSSTALAEAIRRFESKGVTWSCGEIATFAERFSTEEFHRRMRELVAETRERTRIRTEWQGGEK